MSERPEPTDEELARSAKRGNRADYDTLVRRHLRPAMALAWQYTRNVADAEDVVQDAFHKMVRALPRYDETRPFRPWFYTIVRNAARSAVEKDGRREALAPTDALEDELPDREASDPVLASDIESALETLAPMQRACLQLCDVEGFSSSEAGVMLGVDGGTIRTHLHRARRRLRAVLEPGRRS